MGKKETPIDWPELIRKLPGWITGFIAFVTAVVGFIRLWREEIDLVTAVLIVVGVGGSWLGCLRIWRKTKVSPITGKPCPAYPRWRSWALAGLILIPLLATTGLEAWGDSEIHCPDQVVVLVADFYQEGTGADPYGLTGIILEQLREALADEPAASVRALDRPITVQEGSDQAREIGRRHLYLFTLGDRALGQKRRRAIVIWGWYARTEEKALVYAHFERVPLRMSSHIPLDGQPVSLAEMESFEFQIHLSHQMASLTSFTVGLVHYEDEAYKAAIELFSHALARTEDLLEAIGQGTIYLYRAAAYLYQRDYGQAVKDYDRAIEINPQDAGAYNNRGLAFDNLGEHRKAIEDFNRAIEIAPQEAMIYSNRGIAYYNLGGNRSGG